jgi:histidine ammonia-lyase
MSPAHATVVGDALTVEQVADVALRGHPVALSAEARERIESARRATEALLARDERVYGLTTGLGALKRVRVARGDQLRFNSLQLRSHRTGTGADVPERVVRAAMLAQLAGFAAGYSGVRPALADHLVGALNAGLAPRVRTVGSLGVSDLAPLAEIACALTGEGEWADELARLGLEPWRPESKESLAFINSNAFTLGWAALALGRAAVALDRLDEAAALTFEGMLGNVQAFDAAVAEARPLSGSARTIARVRSLLEGGALLREGHGRDLQDPLTMRVVPQTHGAGHTAHAHARGLVEAELVSSHDNPLITRDGRALSNGNFDSLPYGVALDYLRIALAHVVTVSSERANKLTHSAFSGLATGLRADDGSSDDGLGIVVYGATAAAAEVRLLAQPTTLDLPTTTTAEGIEDRVVPTTLGARRLEEQCDLALYVAAVELYCAAQAIDLRGRVGELGAGTSRLYELVRSHAPFVAAGEAPAPDLRTLERALAG